MSCASLVVDQSDSIMERTLNKRFEVMTTITLSMTIGEDRRLVIDLPPEVPAGEVEITIHPKVEEPSAQPQRSLTREEAREILRKAGVLDESIKAPEGYVPLSPEELLKLGTLPPDARSSLDLINEDRGEY